MKILYLLVDSSLMSGISRHVLGIVQVLAGKSEYEVAVCTVFPRGELNEAIEHAGGGSYALGLHNFNSWRVYGRFRQMMKTFRPDVIHIHVITFWQWVYLALFSRKIKTIFTMHSDYGNDTRAKQLMRRFLPLKISRYVFVSQGVRDAYDAKHFPGEVVYNCVPASAPITHGKLMRELGLSADTPIIGTACKISAVKRPEVFVRVMSDVLSRNPNAHAVVIGDGEPSLIHKLKSIIHSTPTPINDTSRFHFLGYRAEARDLVSDFKVFLMTSQREGMPTAMLEAMGAGVPVAFMRGRGGLRELADLNASAEGPFGIVADEGDEANLADGIGELLNNEKKWKRCSENARRICHSRFNFNRELVKLEKVYHS